MISLCRFCNAANRNRFPENKCYICGGRFEIIDELINNVAENINSDFSVSTRIPKKWLEREELVWDFHLKDAESIKTYVNRYINQKLNKKTGKRFGPDADVMIVFDIDKGKTTVELNDLFIFGRYQKLVPGISQTRWTCKNCGGKGCEKCRGKGKLYESVEEKIGETMKKETKAKDYTMHASGREDIDVVTTAKRPFVMQLAKAENRKPNLKRIEKEIAEGKEVAVSDLKIVKRGKIELIGSSHFDKEYEVEVEFEKEPAKEQIDAVLSLEGKVIDQKTPERVAHRRAKLTRKRKILGVKLVSRKGNKAKFRIKTEAGTYIKELITGDEGRTEPSFSSLADMKTICASLEVVKIEDEFLKEIIG
jgi:tRNA pseudouridine synthase 10